MWVGGAENQLLRTEGVGETDPLGSGESYSWGVRGSGEDASGMILTELPAERGLRDLIQVPRFIDGQVEILLQVRITTQISQKAV